MLDTSREWQLLQDNRATFSDEFVIWFFDNQHVFKAFCDEVFKVRGQGFTHYSARTIVEVLRHHSAVAEVAGAGWKIDNDMVPSLARLFDLRYPSCAGMFRMRSKAQAVPA